MTFFVLYYRVTRRIRVGVPAFKGKRANRSSSCVMNSPGLFWRSRFISEHCLMKHVVY